MSSNGPDLPSYDENLTEIFRLVKDDPAKNNAPVINDVLANATAVVVKAENRDLWLSSLRSLAEECEDETLPVGILVEPLAKLGVPLVGTDLTPSDVLRQALTNVTAVQQEELLLYAGASDLEFSIAKTDADATLGIAHDIDALFVETVRTKDGPRIGVGGHADMDWLPGVTTYDRFTGILENFRFILKPHAANVQLTEMPGSAHIIGNQVTARIVDGELRDIKVSQVITEACSCS